MVPVLKSGDLLHVLFDFTSELEEGDIVISKQESEFVAHRLINVSGKLYSKGDQSLGRDADEELKPFGLVTGYSRGKLAVSWGKKGHPNKKMMAQLSKLTEIKEKPLFHQRCLRRIALMTMNVINHFIKIRLFNSAAQSPSTHAQ